MNLLFTGVTEAVSVADGEKTPLAGGGPNVEIRTHEHRWTLQARRDH